METLKSRIERSKSEISLLLQNIVKRENIDQLGLIHHKRSVTSVSNKNSSEKP